MKPLLTGGHPIPPRRLHRAPSKVGANIVLYLFLFILCGLLKCCHAIFFS